MWVFIILCKGFKEGSEKVKDLRDHMAKEIRAMDKPKKILIVAELPKTQSCIIMRKFLRDATEYRSLSDVTNLADLTAMN